MKKIICLLFILLISIGFITAQSSKINGLIVASEDNSPFPGATIRVKGSDQGTISDMDGAFSLHLTDANKTLVISFIGRKTVEMAATPHMRIALYPETQNLDEVVATAIGIKRSWKSLGYASTVISDDELTKAREGNLVNALAGKVAGVRVSQSSGTLGGSSKIQIRGASSISSVSSPLFVIDGMPIDNTAYNPDKFTGYIDGGNRAGDISVDNIESMNILKGAAATALYGARAKDGAIIITTKRGNKNSKTSVEFNSSTRFETVSKLPYFQNVYGPGTGGVYNEKSMNGWGPNIEQTRAEGKKFIDHTGQENLLQIYPNNVKDFFETGLTYINNVALSGGNEKTDFRAGIASYNQKGTIPGTAYDRYTFSLNAGTQLAAGLSARVSMQYIRNNSKGRPAQGVNNVNSMLPLIYGLPRTMDINYLKNNWIDEKGNQISMGNNSLVNNPYWTVNKNKFTGGLDRLIGNFLLNYNPVKGLTFSNNLGMDYYNETRRKVYAKGTLGNLEGEFQDRTISSRIINNDFMMTYEHAWNDFAFKGIAGHNLQQEEWINNSTSAIGLIAPDVYTYANAKETSPSNYSQKKRLVGVYFDLGLSYKSLLFLNVTGRNDWSSTLPVNNRSYFYPSISGSFVFSELIQNQHILDFGKIRINYANVGSDTDPYQLKYQYTPAEKYSLQYSISNSFPHNGLIGFYGPAVLPLANLKPQNQNAFEIGTELMFFNKRIHFDFTYYKNVTTNQIVSIEVPISTGYSGNTINAGKLTNKGVEIALTVTPVQTPQFKWDIGLNYASNKQIVNEISEELTKYTLTSALDNVSVAAEAGQSFGIYGTGWLRDENGNFIIDEATGLRKTETGVRLGDISPNFTMGISNHFVYKGFDLSFLIDIRQGGKLYSGTVGVLRSSGLVTETLTHRGETFIDPGVIIDKNGNSRPNDVPVKDMETYWGHVSKTSNAEGSIFDASYVKLRELTLSYTFPRQWFNKAFVKSLQIGFEARNLWTIKSHVPHIDPEVNLYGPASLGEGVEYYNIPSTRSFGFNLKLSI